MHQQAHELLPRIGGPEDMTKSKRHRVLASKRRRETLGALAGISTPVTIEDLADVMVSRNGPEASPNRETRRNIEIELHHIHLPLMTAMGVLEYDPDAGRVDVQS